MSITTRPCGRCGGSGHYSYNELHGTVCYGCGGKGVVPCAPKGQAKIKPTAELKRCKVGDIIMCNLVLYRVNRIQWIKIAHRGYDTYNQVVRVTRLIDDKAFKLWRGVTKEDGSSFGYSKSIDGLKIHFGAHYIEPTEDMVGQDTDVIHIAMNDEERAEAMDKWADYIKRVEAEHAM